MVKLYFRI